MKKIIFLAALFGAGAAFASQDPIQFDNINAYNYSDLRCDIPAGSDEKIPVTDASQLKCTKSPYGGALVTFAACPEQAGDLSCKSELRFDPEHITPQQVVVSTFSTLGEKGTFSTVSSFDQFSNMIVLLNLIPKKTYYVVSGSIGGNPTTHPLILTFQPPSVE
jgi:hypothetical protein